MSRSVADLIDACRSKAHLYKPREVDFLTSIHVNGLLTDAQMKWLEALASREEIDFEKINNRALAVLLALCRRWLPDGKMHGKEYVARNPTRSDTSPGSFRINTVTGRWADFADEAARGGEPVSLAAYLFHANDQMAAAIDLKRMLAA